MDHQILSKEEIERHAFEAARQGSPVSSCPYPWWTTAAIMWRVEYYTAVSEQNEVL